MIRTEVIIVGAGPVGLCVALGLAQQGISTIVLDSDPEPPCPVAPAMAPLLQDAVSQRLLAQSFKLPRPYALYDGPVQLRSLRSQFVLQGKADTGLPDIDGQQMRAALLEALQSFDHVQVLWDHQVRELGQRDSEVRVLVQTDEGDCVIEGDFIIGADGVHSTVRRTLGMRWLSLWDAGTDGQRLLQFNVKAALDEAGYAPLHLLCDSENWAVVAKSVIAEEWQIVCAALDTQGSASKRAEQRFAELFPDRAADAVVTQANTLIAHHRVAERSRVGKVFLAGDAAYEVPLWSGLGLGNGLDDACGLANALAQMLRHGADDAIVDDWCGQRMAVVRDTVAPKAAQVQAMLMNSALDAETLRMIFNPAA